MFPLNTAPTEIVLKSAAMNALPKEIRSSGHIYCIEPVTEAASFIRICASPDGAGRHTTVNLDQLDLKASMALW